MWLLGTMMDNANLGFFHHRQRFCGTALLPSIISPDSSYWADEKIQNG